MSREDFRKLYLDELRDIYNAENQILEALPKMIEAAELPELKKALKHHLNETQEQVTRLNTIFSKQGENSSGETCEAMEGLIKEGSRIIKTFPMSIIRDAALIAAAQRIEHYEISAYGTLRTFAKLLDFDDDADLLQETLDEEANANEKLNDIAEGGFFTSGVNQKAMKRK